jgi:hypothetical protein
VSASRWTVERTSPVAWLGAAEDSGAAQVRGGIPFFPGSWVTYSRQADDGMSFNYGPGWSVVVVTLVMFIVFSRPWVALRRKAVAGTEDSDRQHAGR